ncbi:right-handed parallel beta-helix repeat-containing protein, partial [Candidatus Woesearchaeota archaeon]|nr:right-handed parallel beta-helix repeat-containing protein [Candidatus Woesearchaeota archaeon]
MKLNKKAEVTLAIFLVAAAVAFVFALSIPDQSNSITGMAVAGANISGCANISIDSELTQDIYVNLSDAIGSWCISFQTNDIILDCQGHSLNGNGSGIGIISGNLDNITIKNCQVNNFTSGIQMRTNNSFVINNTASFNTEDGFIIGYGYYGVINAFVENNTAINNSRHPFYIINASYSQIKNNRAYNHSNGVYNIQSSHYNQILNNLAYDNYGGFTLSYSSHDNHLFNNTVHNNQVFNGNSYEFITDSYNNVLNQSYYTGNSTVVNLRVGQSFT